jgi:FdhD protein
MRTPGEEVPQAVGFCLGEGIVDSPDDIRTVGYDDQLDSNLVDVWLQPQRASRVRGILERKRLVSQTSCGICGKNLIEDLHQNLTPADDSFVVPVERVFACLAGLDQRQQHYATTRASHAAALFDDRLELISMAEDVGRHNALDKAIGRAFIDERLPRARLLVLSSRNSYELVQKAARARIPIVVSRSRPTALAVELGESLGMTLTFPNGSDLIVVCGEGRIGVETG